MAPRGTVSTAQGALRSTFSVTEPRTSRSNPPRPCVPSTITSAAKSCAALRISRTAWPSRSSVSTVTLTLRTRAASAASALAACSRCASKSPGSPGRLENGATMGKGVATCSRRRVAPYEAASAAPYDTAASEKSEKSVGHKIRPRVTTRGELAMMSIRSVRRDPAQTSCLWSRLTLAANLGRMRPGLRSAGGSAPPSPCFLRTPRKIRRSGLLA